MLISAASQLTGSANIGVGSLVILFIAGFVLFNKSLGRDMEGKTIDAEYAGVVTASKNKKRAYNVSHMKHERKGEGNETKRTKKQLPLRQGFWGRFFRLS